MANGKRSQALKPMWAYAYQIVPSQTEDRLRTVLALLDNEHAEARRGERTWAGKVVVLEQQITSILVVSDSPEQNREVNRRLEAELTSLKAGFSVTASMAVESDGTESPGMAGPFESQ